MKNKLLLLAFSLVLPGCFHTRHYVEDATQMDGLFFGSVRDSGEDRCEEYRAWALYGLVAWRQEDSESPGRLLAEFRRGDEVLNGARFETFSKFSLLDGLLTIFAGFSGRLVFAPRTGGIEFEPAAPSSVTTTGCGGRGSDGPLPGGC